MEKMVYVRNDMSISKKDNKTDKYALEEPVRDSITSLNVEIVLAIKAAVHSAVGGAKREVLQKTVVETFRDIFLNG